MSQVDKLLIRGIRSFDPDSANVIEFYSPLTLIVGHNGSGKTYATTGDLPPNSKNGAFIHDPKISNLPETKAQVKLKFHNVNGQQLVCTRSLSLTQKKTTVSQKTLESILMMKNEHGEQLSVSNRCAELDVEIPNQLGVSKSILENVIFCHQEESFWPLSEPSVLKKKFDEIFAATKYTKALENIKAFRKEQAVTLKLEQQHLNHLKIEKERAEKIKGTRFEIESKIGSKRKRIETLEIEEIRSLENEIQVANSKQQSLIELNMQLNQFELERESLKRNIAELKKNLVEYHEDDDTLQGILNGYLETAGNRKEQQQKLSAQKLEYQKSMDNLTSRNSELQGALGKIAAQKENLEKRIKERDELLSRVVTKNDNKDPNAIMDALRNKLLESYQSSDAAKTEFRKTEEFLSTEIQQLKARLVVLTESKETMANEQTQTTKKLDQMYAETSRIEQTQMAKSRLESSIEILSKELNEINAKLSDSSTCQKQTDLKSRIQILEEKMMKTADEMSQLNQSAGSRAQFSFMKSNLNRLQSEFKEKLGATNELQMTVFGYCANSASNISNEVEKFLTANLKRSQDLKAQVEKNQLETSVLNEQLEAADKQFTSKKLELSRCKTEIERVCGSLDYESTLNEQQSIVDDLKEQLSEMKAGLSMYSKYVTRCEQSSSCPLCKRKFELKKEQAEFTNSLKTTVERLPSKLEPMEQELKDSIEKLNSIKKLQSTAFRMKQLQSVEIVNIEQKIKEIKEKLNRNTISNESGLDVLLKTIESATKLKNQSLNLMELENEIKKEVQKIDEISKELEKTGSVKTIEDCSMELEEYKKQLQSTRRELEECQSTNSTLGKTSRSKQTELDDLRRQLQQIQQESRDLDRFKHEISELRSKLSNFTNELKQKQDLVDDIKPKLFEKEAKLADLNSQFKSVESTRLTEQRTIQETVNRLNMIQQEISEYENDGSESQLLKEINELEAKQKQLKQSIEQVDATFIKLDKQSSEVQVLERNVDDNLKYRRMNREFIEISNKIKSLESKVSGTNASQVLKQLDKMKKQMEDLVSEKATLNGELKQLEEQFKRTNQELKVDYGNVESDHQQQFLKLKTEEMAFSDLEKYSKALDSAIMKYHSVKMNEINKIIRELWIHTYRGSDIDTIAIKTEQENTKGNRSYNYRVVLVKGNTELDMRGRCSAGQKVLACIIIRLALAETFGLSCGILALDEPTTNLDRDNIVSLAKSLVEIIKHRRRQKNFQLLVITHDEDFIRIIGKSDFADFYYRVHKDMQGHSVIERQEIQSV